MNLYLRQICLVAEQLDPVTEAVEAILGAPVCHVDPAVAKFGLENALMAFGTQFLEIVAPTGPGTAAGRYLHRRGGNGGYMVITQALDKSGQEAVRANAADRDVRVSYDSDRGDWHFMQLHPGDMGAAFLEVDWNEYRDPTGFWHPAGGLDWQDHAGAAAVTAITAAELQSDDPVALAALWGGVAGQPVETRDGVPHVALANADLRFVAAKDGRGAGLGAIDLRTPDPARVLAAAEARDARLSATQVTICGTRINLVP